MGFYVQADLPFYYALAENFAIDDGYFSSVAGSTLPNRSYELAATSFGHMTTAEMVPPTGGYKPSTGTIFDLLDKKGVTWADYSDDVPQGFLFRNISDQAHFRGFSGPGPFGNPLNSFLQDAAADTLPAVSFVDPNFGFTAAENDEHPPTDIRAGEFFVSQVIAAVHNSSAWKDSIIFITYDDHGGFYDHVGPPRAPQGGFSSPDGIDPGLCEDLSDQPMSLMPGFGAKCTISNTEAQSLCPLFNGSPPYPAFCANFNQLGFRVPFMAVSPFAKPHYVSHTVADHTSILALIEKRFFSLNRRSGRSHLTNRDLHAATLEDMFDFNRSPSLNATIPTAPAPSSSDPGCPFAP